MGKRVAVARALRGPFKELPKLLELPKGGPKKIVRAAAPSPKTVAAKAPRTVPNRTKYVGRTPGKTSKTGREVISRMRGEIPPAIKGVGEDMQVRDASGKWHYASECDMGHHPVDAVVYWNSTGRHTGAKSPEVRAWMLDSNNYRIQPSAQNRAAGARLGITYLPPI